MTDKPRLPPGVAPLPAQPIVPRAQGGQRMGLPQAMALAEQHQREGRLAQAATVLQQILAARPRHAPALHLLGVVTHQLGQTEQAVEFLTKAIELDSKQALYYANRGELCRMLGRLDDAIADGERAIALDPKLAAAYSNVGIAYYDRRDFERAESYQRRALAIEPRLAPALNNLASIRRQLNDRDGAIAAYREVLTHHPNYAEAINNLGACLSEAECYDEAIAELLRAIRLRPNYADAHCNIGIAFTGQQQFDKAIAAFRRALELRPDYVEAHMGLARVQQESNHLPEAEQAARRALELAPDKAEAHCLLGGIYEEQGFPERAAAAFERALELDPELPRAHLAKGALLTELGRLDDAETCYRRALELDPENTAARVSLTQVKKVAKDDPNLAALVTEGERIDSLPAPRAMALHFALGKCFDDVGDYDRAFGHFQAGCSLKRATLQYDSAGIDQLVDQLIEFFNANLLERLAGCGNPSQLPIFVLGMARSGTTLTEQIIASHPQVHGAGELPDLLDIANRPREGETQPFPQNVAGFGGAEFTALGQRYVTGLAKRAPEALRITDKMPANYLCVGLLRLMLPNARVVHVRRDPVDTCLSGFSRLFKRGQPHSYDLVEIGRYYRAYARLMAHWRSVLPAGAMLEVQYEDLVNDNEAQAHRLIDYCGLEWDDACLEFFKTDRSIRTASVVQVRQPIYKTSMQRWRRYESHLGPLLDALGDLVPARETS